jgi:hypothetical protein
MAITETLAGLVALPGTAWELRKQREALESLAASGQRIAAALERIAQVADGQILGEQPLPVDLAEPPQAEIVTMGSDHTRIAAYFEAECTLRTVLGRDPEPEEIDQLVRGEEWGEADAVQRLAQAQAYAESHPGR